MPSKPDNDDGAASARQPEEQGNALAEALMRLARTQREQLAVLQQLNRRIGSLEERRDEHRTSQRLALQLEAMRREPRLSFAWLATPLRQAARKALGRTRYRKLEFQLELERAFEELGTQAALDWVRDSVERGDVLASVAYPMLAEALATRNELLSLASLAEELKQRYATDPTLQNLAQRVAREQAAPTPAVQGDSIVWRSKIGPRSHKLAMPARRLGQRAWAHWSTPGLAPRLTALTVGRPSLARWFEADLDWQPASLDDLRLQLVRQTPDLCVADLRALMAQSEASPGSPLPESSLDAVSARLEQLVAGCEEVAALPILWLGADVSSTSGLGKLRVPAFTIVLTETEATRRTLLEAGLSCAVHVLGPVVETRVARQTRSRHAGCWQLDLDQAGEARLTDESWPVGAASDVPPQLLVVRGNAAGASHQQLCSIAHAAAEGCPVMLSSESRATLSGPLCQLPALEGDGVSSLTERLRQLAKDPQHLARQAHRGARFASEQLSSRAALQRLVVHSGAPSISHGYRQVSVLCVSNRPERAKECLASFQRQSYPHKELIFVANVDTLADAWVERFLNQTERVTLLRSDAEYSLGESLNRARSVANGELWAKFDDDDHYGDNYLRDSVLALARGEAAVTGKGTFFCYVKQQNKLYLNPQHPENSPAERFVHGGTLLADRRFVEGIDFQPVKHGTDSLFLQECKLSGHRIFSGDRYNFAYIRYPAAGHHTYGVSNESYLRACQEVCDGFDQRVVDV